jgi:hypothetical protein
MTAAADPVLAALDAAPLAEEPLSAAEQASLDEALAVVRAGCVRMVPHEEMLEELRLDAAE